METMKINTQPVMQHLLFLTGCLVFALLSCQGKNAAHKSAPAAAPDPQHAGNPYYSRTDTTVLNVSDAEWKKVLPDSVYHIAREKGTEYAFTGKYWNYTGLGTYYCAACGNALFRSDSKFASDCGWPSFFEAMRPTAVRYADDDSYDMERIEVLCGRCGGHLGHVFDDGPPPTGKRFCMNSIVLEFEPDQVIGGPQ